jgi:putative aldouronate transport system permease protein
MAAAASRVTATPSRRERPPVARATGSGFLRHLGEYRQILLMLAPATLFFLLFSYLPMLGIVLAFENFNLRDGFLSPFIGLENFRFLFITGDVWAAARNTILYNLAFIVVDTVLQVAVAVMISELASKSFKKVAQTLLFLPYFISWVVVGAFAYSMLNYDKGMVNHLLAGLELPPYDFYNSPGAWPVLIIMLNAWKGLGMGSIIYVAVITSLGTEMYEAADIDGATIFKKTRYITLPSLVPTMIILVLLAVGNIFRGNFAMFYQLIGNNAVLLPTTDVVDTFVTRSLLYSNNISMAASAGLVQSVVCFVVIMAVNRIVRSYDPAYALF